MDRDLSIGLIAALVIHSGLAWCVAALPVRPKAVVMQKEPLVKTVREEVQLPKPQPKPETPEPEAVKPPPPPKPAESAPKLAKASAPKSRSPQPRSDSKPVEQPAKNEPQPLQLSKTYGSEGPGVAVNAGQDESLGDPAVEPTEANTRKRDDGPARPGRADGGDGDGDGPATPERKVEIVHAVPKSRCKVEWPEGADAGNRVVEVLLSLEIGLDGKVNKARLLKPAGEPFDSAAVRAVKACQFQPGLRDGKAFADRVPFAIEFKPSGR